MTGDRDRGIHALYLWWSNTGASSAYSFDQLTAHYDAESPNFLEFLGGAVRLSGLDEQRVRDKLVGSLPYGGPDKVPPHQDFMQAISDEANSGFTVSDYLDIAGGALSDTKSTLEKTATLVDSKLTKYALLAGGLYLLYIFGPELKVLIGHHARKVAS